MEVHAFKAYEDSLNWVEALEIRSLPDCSEAEASEAQVSALRPFVLPGRAAALRQAFRDRDILSR